MLSFPPQVKKSPVFPSSSRDEGLLPCFTWKGMPTSPSHLERRLVSTSPWMGTHGSCQNTKATYFPIHSRSGLIPLPQFLCQLRINSQHEESSDAPVAKWKRAPGPIFHSDGGMKPLDNSRGKQNSMPPHTLRPDSLFETAYSARDPRQNRTGTLRFPPQLEMRPSSITPKPLESREAPPNSTVSLTSHRHPEMLPEVTVTS